MQYYMRIKEKDSLLCSSVDAFQRYYVEQKRPDVKDDILYTSAYVKFKNRQN